ncbi:(deoxy)nucleoside triphosphate pyrophosphohydrolase [Herbiconiux moechotypicola]|uniref:8-oxo-dGTP diphosphatase n=1 Tax=Herbiconiux moechotypicola TaxID=637393 RepID=A0ABP5Q321_9MICO|nr:(deoxy)nucleoside triphosphate pyrophosphohydrolase [Herbiconiux moechotypicola]MCS5728138.1 (deoxy)nucleoside triphosphate pyrophosphohydrolase [Herbiconiux moechotypicola]
MTKLQVVAAVFIRDGNVLGCRRAPGRVAAGQWEFPGGKVEPGEDPRFALQREVAEELGIDVTVGDLLDRTPTAVGELTIDLACYGITEYSLEPIASSDHDALSWFAPEDVFAVSWAKPDLPMVRKIAAWRMWRSQNSAVSFENVDPSRA